MKPLVILIYFSPFFSYAQNRFNASHTLFAEAFGAGGGYYSINYDKILFANAKSVYSIRIGASALYGRVDTNKKAWGFNFPIGINWWSAINKKHHFEIGTGGFITWDYYGDGQKVIRGVRATIIGFLGYRYQKPEGGLMIRGGWTPFYSIYYDWFYPWLGGIGIGYTF